MYEEIPFKGPGLVHVSDFILYYVQKKLFRIDLPWLAVMKECYKLKKPPKNLLPSDVVEIQQNLEIFEFCCLFSGIKNIVILSLNRGILELNLKVSNNQGYFSIDRKYLTLEYQNPTDISIPCTENLKKAAFDLPPYEGDENEVLNLLQIFDKFIVENGNPLVNKIEGIKERILNCVRNNENLNKSYEILGKKTEELEGLAEKIHEKIEMISQNDEKIRNRIQDIVDIQQNVKRPLTSAEKELSLRLSHLENLSKTLKNHTAEVIFN